MIWVEIKESIQKELLSKNIKKPNIRLGALDRIENILKNNFKEFIEEPLVEFNKISKNDFKNKLAKYKPNGQLNGAEESIINIIYNKIQ